MTIMNAIEFFFDRLWDFNDLVDAMQQQQLVVKKENLLCVYLDSKVIIIITIMRLIRRKNMHFAIHWKRESQLEK